MEGSIGGTPAYMAPEVIGGDFYDPRSDIYALGILNKNVHLNHVEN